MANNDAAISSNTAAISSIDSSIVNLSGDVTNNILDVTNLKVCSVLHSKYFTFLVWEVRESKHIPYFLQVMKLKIYLLLKID